MRHDWHLLAAFEGVITRLIGERRINFRMLAELEEMRDDLHKDLVSRGPQTPTFEPGAESARQPPAPPPP